jgi:hypothetical protein
MTEYIELPNGRCDIKFHCGPKNFKKVHKLVHGKKHLEIYTDKNGQVFEVLNCVVKTWKAIEKGKRKFTVPDAIIRKREVELFNLVKGRPLGLALKEILMILDRASVEGEL